LLVVELGDDALHPTREFDFYIQRRAIAGITIGVAESRENFVLDIPRRPQAIQIKSAGADNSLAELLESHLSIHALIVQERAQVAIPLRILNRFQLTHDIIGAFFEPGVARGCPHETHCREIVPGYVPGQLPSCAIPASVMFTLRLKSR